MWHPLRAQFFWFDVINKRLLSRGQGEGPVDCRQLQWEFDELVSAAGWLDRENLFLASETALSVFSIRTGAREIVVPLESETQTTRSNDGRVDPHGGFWIGTMGKAAESEAGSIYRYFRGEMRRIHERITIPNSICFSPDGGLLYFADTPKQSIFVQRLDSSGWPKAGPERLIDLRTEGHWPDGSAVDSEGAIWNAQWGSGRVARYLPDGTFDQAVRVPGIHTSCPAFGGSDLKTLLVTSAQEHIEKPSEFDGLTYCVPDSAFRGIAEPPVQI